MTLGHLPEATSCSGRSPAKPPPPRPQSLGPRGRAPEGAPSRLPMDVKEAGTGNPRRRGWGPASPLGSTTPLPGTATVSRPENSCSPRPRRLTPSPRRGLDRPEDRESGQRSPSAPASSLKLCRQHPFQGPSAGGAINASLTRTGRVHGPQMAPALGCSLGRAILPLAA